MGLYLFKYLKWVGIELTLSAVLDADCIGKNIKPNAI